MKTFCLDFQPAVAQGAGIGRYTRELARGLLPLLAPEERLRLFYCDFRRRAAADPVPGAEARAFRLLPGAALQKLWTRLGAPAFDRFSGAADLFHFTNFVARPVRRGRVVVSIHDMSFERFPQFAEARNRAYLHANVARSVARADAILTDSEFSKREIEELLPAARGKTFAARLGIAPDWRPATAEQIGAVRAALGLPRPFLLDVGTVEPRKNRGRRSCRRRCARLALRTDFRALRRNGEKIPRALPLRALRAGRPPRRALLGRIPLRDPLALRRIRLSAA